MILEQEEFCELNTFKAEKDVKYLNASDLLDDAYSDIRDILNDYCRDNHCDPASVLVVGKIIESVVNTIKEKNYIL